MMQLMGRGEIEFAEIDDLGLRIQRAIDELFEEGKIIADRTGQERGTSRMRPTELGALTRRDLYSEGPVASPKNEASAGFGVPSCSSRPACRQNGEDGNSGIAPRVPDESLKVLSGPAGPAIAISPSSANLGGDAARPRSSPPRRGRLVSHDPREQALAHFHLGSFASNSAWAAIGTLARYLGHWITSRAHVRAYLRRCVSRPLPVRRTRCLPRATGERTSCGGRLLAT